MSPRPSTLVCVLCQKIYPLDDDRIACDCSGLLEVRHDFLHIISGGFGHHLRHLFSGRRENPQGPADKSGIWRFRELVLPGLAETEMVTRGEGNTRIYRFERTDRYTGCHQTFYKHEGENPTGSFKDRGMTVAVSWAKKRGAKLVACASTGNTSASVASYAAAAGIPAVILVAEGKTAVGKISQSLAYGAKTVMIRGDFDAAMHLVLDSRRRLGLSVMNSVNAFRLEGQKTIIWEALEQLDWDPPDWIVVPGGNLGNTSAFGKALREAFELGMICKVPRLAVIQAAGADPFCTAYENNWAKLSPVKADTLATAIRIGEPVNYEKAVRAIKYTQGLVTRVSDQEIMDAKAVLDSDGVGAEPASCATVAGLKKLVAERNILPHERVLAILTGNLLKDSEATVGYHRQTLPGITAGRPNAEVVIDPTIEELEKVLVRP
ncbi:MAG: threonine synthase [Patescibacteria group bacterium]